jgi:hypothetical protein
MHFGLRFGMPERLRLGQWSAVRLSVRLSVWLSERLSERPSGRLGL